MEWTFGAEALRWRAASARHHGAAPGERSKGVSPDPRSRLPPGSFPGAAGNGSVAPAMSMALLCRGSLGTVMLGFLAEGLFIPLLAAYLITLVVGVALVVLRSGARPGTRRDPRGREKLPVVAGKIALSRPRQARSRSPRERSRPAACAASAGTRSNQYLEKTPSHQGRRPHDPPHPRRRDARPAGRRHPGRRPGAPRAGQATRRTSKPAETQAPTVEVIGKTPLPGLGVPISEVPSNVQGDHAARRSSRPSPSTCRTCCSRWCPR